MNYVMIYGFDNYDNDLYDCIPSVRNGISVSTYEGSSSRAVMRQEPTCVQSSSNVLTLQANIKSILSADSSVQI